MNTTETSDRTPRAGPALPRWSLLVLAGLLALVAGLVLYGWLAGRPLLFQYHPLWVPTQSSSAFGLLACAATLALVALKLPLAARLCAGGAAFWGLAVCAEPLLDLPLGTGAASFFWGPLGVDAGPVGLQAGLCLVFAGGLLNLVGRPPSARTDRTAGFLVLFLVLLLGLSLSGSLLGISALSRMGVAEVVGFALVAAAGGLVLGRRYPLTLATLARWLPQGVAVGCGLATLVLWQALSTQDRQRFRRVTQAGTDQVVRAVEDSLAEQLAPLRELSREWARTPPRDTIPPGWKAAATDYLGSHPGCLGVAFVPAGGGPRWVETLREPGPLETDTFETEARRDALLGALREDAELAVRRVSRRGRPRLVVYAPAGKRPSGVLAVMDPEQLLGTALNRNVAPGYAVVVSDGAIPLYRRLASERGHAKEWGQQVNLPLFGGRWTVQVWPTPEVLARERHSLPRFALLAGLLMASLLGVMVHLARTAVARARSLGAEIHERRQAEAALRASEAKYRSLVEGLEQGVFLKDRDRRFVAANGPFRASLGLTEEALLGRTDEDLYPEEQAAGQREDDLAILGGEATRVEREVVRQAKRVPDLGSSANDTWTTKNREAHLVRIIRTPVKDEAGQIVGVLGICWDVTDQRALEEQLRQAQKMEAVGQLAGGIAHDFNNLLTGILGNLSLIQIHLGAKHPAYSLAATAEQAGLRASELTKQLLGFSRRNRHLPQGLDLRRSVEEVVALTRPTMDPRIHLDADFPEDLWAVRGDPGQLNQVLLNLCLNACDAMTGGGRLTLRAKNVTVPQEGSSPAASFLNARRGLGSLNATHPGEYVHLRVRDTGRGMPPEVKERIFEPFFTTKETGKGTGLGLARVFGGIQQHKGWIEVVSEVGKGTCFEIFLPRFPEALPAPAPPEVDCRTPVPPAEGKGTILVVDDEHTIRDLAQTVLGQAGFQVLLAEDGRHGVEVFAEEQQNIDAVLLDLRMPRLSGGDTLRRMRLLDPGVKVIFMSGHAPDSLDEETRGQARAFLPKPFPLEELTRTVETVLREASPSAGDRPRAFGLDLSGGRVVGGGGRKTRVRPELAVPLKPEPGTDDPDGEEVDRMIR